MAITQWQIIRALAHEELNIFICDDDQQCIDTLRSGICATLQRLNRTAVFTVCSDPALCTPEMMARCDLAFLDIDFEQSEENGIDIARRLRVHNRRALIFFVTNYIDYAPEGFEVQAFRYILKRDLGQMLERYFLQAMENLTEDATVLRLTDREATVDILLEQISYLEVLDHYVSIHAGKESYTMVATLSSLEQGLERHGFLRIHKSYLVNMAHIRKFRSRECLMTDGTALAVSEKNYAQQKQKYLLWKGMV